jgi:hypothetical protein
MHAFRPIRQVAYFVPDIVAAARDHAALHGSGPYYVAEHIQLSYCEHRGRPAHLDHSSAYGQWGEVMIEFVQQNNDGPSVFRDLYSAGRYGFHHVALIVEDLKPTMASFNEAGFATGLYAEVAPGLGFAMMDCCERYGHFVELYEPTPVLLGIYDMVKSAAQGFRGEELIRPFRLS